MMKRISAHVVALAIVSAPALALAAGAAGLPSRIVPCDGPDCTVCSLAQLAQNVLNTAIFLAVFLSGILFAIAGFNILSNQGDTKKIDTGRKMLWNVTIGLVIILAGWLIVDTLMKTMTNGHYGPWNAVC